MQNGLFIWHKSALFIFFDLCVVVREVEPAENHLKDMLQQLNTLMAAKPSEKATICQGESTPRTLVDMSFCGPCTFSYLLFIFVEEAEDPACVPIFWISKWVDYSDKYGLGKKWLDPTTRLDRSLWKFIVLWQKALILPHSYGVGTLEAKDHNIKWLVYILYAYVFQVTSCVTTALECCSMTTLA